MSHKNWRWIRYFWLALVIVIGALFSTRSTMAAFYVRKISGVMPAYASVDSNSMQTSPDGLYVVFLADIDQDTIRDLYSVPIHGGIPTRLTQSTLPERTVSVFQISPDSSRVVIMGDLNVSGKNEIYSVSITGGVQTRLNPSMGSEMDVRDDFEISQNSQTVLYRADQDIDEIFNLYAVPISGGPVIRLNQTLSVSEDVSSMGISPDSQKAVYKIFNNSINQGNLYFTPLGGGDIKILNSTLVSGGSINQYLLKPDSSGVVYAGDQDLADASNLYDSDFYSSIGPNPIKLTDFSPDNTFNSLEITPDGSWVVFETSYVLYSVRTNGTVEEQPINGATGQLTSWAITPNSLGVVFQTYDSVNNLSKLYSNYLDQLHTPTRLTPELMPENSYISQFKITPNSLGVVYRADQNLDDKIELFSVVINGTFLTQLTPTLPDQADVFDFKITPDSSAVIFRADGITNDVSELFTTLITGGLVARISGQIVPPEGGVSNFIISPGGKKAVYGADAEIDNKFELYMVEDVDLVFLPLLTR